MSKPFHFLFVSFLLSFPFAFGCDSASQVSDPSELSTTANQAPDSLDKTSYLLDGEAVMAISAEHLAELQEKIPLLHADSVGMFHPDSLFNLCWRHYDSEMLMEGFGSEAGQDGFCGIVAIILQQKTGDTPEMEARRQDLLDGYHKINSSFRCVSQGGTLYYHMSERMYAFVEWTLLNGMKNSFQTKAKTKPADISARIIEIAATYGSGYDKESVEPCITELDPKTHSQPNWIFEQCLLFCGEYF